VDRLDQMAGQPVLQRLATWVLRAAEHDETRAFTLGMTQAQLAEELGTVREVVVRGLAQLRDDGAITTVGRGRYRVKDWNALRTIASD
jgi:CRP-like cAMP-binding protein